MNSSIAHLFGILVSFDGGLYLYDPTSGKYQFLKNKEKKHA